MPLKAPPYETEGSVNAGGIPRVDRGLCDLWRRGRAATLTFLFLSKKKKRVRRGAEEAEEWQVLFPSLSGVLRLWLLHPPLWRRNLQFQQDPFCSVK
jgi:hypothetical protein